MSGFIPMVSTTPPPIDDADDDFGDFMDSALKDDDEFADFSSPISCEDYSYPSLNSPSDVTSPAVCLSKEELSPEKDLKKNKIKEDNEVTTILNQHNDGGRNSIVNEPTEFQSSHETSKGERHHTVNGAIIFDKVPTSNIDAENTDFQNGQYEPSTAITRNDIEHDQENTASSAIFNGSPEPDVGDGDIDEDDDKNTDEDIQAESDSEVHRFEDIQSVEPDREPVLCDPEAGLNRLTDRSDNLEELQHQPGLAKESSFGSATSVNFGIELPGADLKVESEDIRVRASEVEIGLSESDVQSSQDLCSDTNAASPEIESDFAAFSSSNDDSQYADFRSKTEIPTSPSKLEDLEDADFDCDFADFASPKIVENESPIGSNGTNERCETDNFGAFKSVPVQETKDDGHGFQSVPNDGTSGESEKFGDFNASAHSQSDQQPTDKTHFDGADASEQHAPLECDFGAFESNVEKSDDDDFADFSHIVHFPPTNVNQTAPDTEFADFSANTTHNDDFADFSSGVESSKHFLSTTVNKKLELFEKVANFVSKYFTCKANEDGCEISVPQLDEHLSTDDTLPKDVDSPSTTSTESMGILWPGDLWDQLEDIDNAIALNFLWNGSGHNKHMLDSLGMHTQNILFSGAKQAYYVPTYYAAGLDLIDPSKGVLKPMSAAEKITAMSPTDKNTPVSKDEIAPQEAHPEWKTIADERVGRPNLTASGGRLHGGQITSNRTSVERGSSDDPVRVNSPEMDLDFFNRLPGTRVMPKPAGSADLIDPELLELTSAPTTDPPPPPRDSGSATLSKILASIKGGDGSNAIASAPVGIAQDDSKWEDEESKLSVEARTVLKKLPDLSYMRAKVLMFPMNMSRVNIGEDM